MWHPPFHVLAPAKVEVRTVGREEGQAESHMSLLVVRKIVRAINHASSVRAIQRMNRDFLQLAEKAG
jgi:hypothetical protein